MTITSAAVDGSVAEGGAEEKGDTTNATTGDGVVKKVKKRQTARATLYMYL
jgi:hypothetical protein